MRSIQHMDNRVPPWDHSSISLVEDLPVAHMEAIHLRWAHPRPHHSNDHLLSRPLPAPHTRAARIQATRWPPRVVILQLPIRQLDHLAFQGPHLLEQQVLLLRQLLTLLQPLLLLAMHSTAKATHKAMVWLMAMGQVEVTPKEVLILVHTLKGAQQHHFVTLQDTLATVTTVLLSQLVSRLLLMAHMSSKVILLVPIPRLSEITKRASIILKSMKASLLSGCH